MFALAEVFFPPYFYQVEPLDGSPSLDFPVLSLEGARPSVTSVTSRPTPPSLLSREYTDLLLSKLRNQKAAAVRTLRLRVNVYFFSLS